MYSDDDSFLDWSRLTDIEDFESKEMISDQKATSSFPDNLKNMNTVDNLQRWAI